MVLARGLVSLVVVLGVSFGGVVAGSGQVLAQGAAPARQPSKPGPRPRPPMPPRQVLPPLVGATEVVKLSSPAGFIDDVVAADGTRLAYVVADGTAKAELHVYTVATQQEVVVDLAELTLQPTRIELVGARVFVVGRIDAGEVGAMFELAARGRKPAGAIVFRVGPATGLRLIRHGGKPRIALHRATTKDGTTRHEVQLLAVETGRRVATARPFDVDEDGRNAKLEFKVNHWSAGMTAVHGIKAGQWDRKEDQRAPDHEATYDLVTRKLSDKKKITDLFEQRKRFQTLAEAKDRIDFVRMAWDNAAVEIWHRGALRTTELDQPLTNYVPASLQGFVAADGSAWVALKVDPVNIEAVARKKADPEYLDLFHVAADGKATRKARVLAPKARHWFGVAGPDQFWLIDRNMGFERGGKSVTLYRVP